MPPFAEQEYASRLERVRRALVRRGLDALVIGDPANINWLTGYDAWSFYTPQIMVVGQEIDPVWIGREMDAGAAPLTTYLKPEQIVGYPEPLVQRPDDHPARFMGEWMASAGLNGKVIGYETDVYFLSHSATERLKAALPDAHWRDADLLVNWERLVKSPAELAMMRQAATIAGCAMQMAYDRAAPGIRQCDLMADVAAAQIRGTPEFGGDMTAINPLILAGEAATTAHPMWTDAPLEDGQTIAFELGGCRKRYNAGLARTVHLGTPPDGVRRVSDAVQDGIAAVLETLKPGVPAGDVHGAWQRVLTRYDLEKKSRIGYSIGVGYAPDWGEHTLSFRPGETTEVPQDATVHVILGMWMDDWGLELSETIHVHRDGARCLTEFPRAVHVKG